MKNLKDKIFESSFPMEFDKSIKTPEKRKVQNAIYKQLEKTGTTGRFYRDDNWEGVRLVGYRKSKDGMSQWKQYKVEIVVKGAEQPFMGGTLNCHAAGTVDDPFDTYDMSCCIGY